ncbi:MAG: hypothetical protein II260_05275 [Muribaculaceae bacterium]|nr:hypothetical protein [Muribaculaceae bacterium]
MKKEGIFIDVWVVSYFNAFDGSNYTKLHANCDKAIADFDEAVDEAIKFASEEMSDFRVSRNLNSLTICDVADDRAVLACEVSKYTIPCGIMCM